MPGAFTLGLVSAFHHGRGFSEPASVDAPAAGVGFTYAVGSKYWERLTSLSFLLVTSSATANRNVLLTVKDGEGYTLATIPANAVQVASLTRRYTFLGSQSSNVGPLGGAYLAGLPQYFLQPTWTVNVTADLIDSGDQFSAIRLVRERFSTGPEGYPLGIVTEDAERAARIARIADILA